MKLFGVWISSVDDIEIRDLLTLVDRCNTELQLKHMEVRGSSKGKGGTLYIIGVREPSLSGLRKLNLQPYAGCRRIQFQEKKPKRARKPEVSTGTGDSEKDSEGSTARQELDGAFVRVSDDTSEV